MKLHEYIKGLSDIVSENPEYGNLEVIYAAKRIAINAASCLSGNWWYSLNGYVEFTPTQGQTQAVYQCKYATGYEVLPADLKQAILAETNYIFNLKGSPVTDLISPNAAMLANSYSRNLVL